MTNKRFNEIFYEELDRFLIEKKSNVSNDTLEDIIKKLSDELSNASKSLRNSKNKSKSDDDDDKDDEDDGKKGGKYKSKKISGDKRELYDYDEYKKTHKSTALADADEIRAKVDLERNNIKDLGQELLPDHTPNGAQSQLRKMFTGEREMTDDIAAKLEKGIDSGRIATK